MCPSDHVLCQHDYWGADASLHTPLVLKQEREKEEVGNTITRPVVKYTYLTPPSKFCSQDESNLEERFQSVSSTWGKPYEKPRPCWTLWFVIGLRSLHHDTRLEWGVQEGWEMSPPPSVFTSWSFFLGRILSGLMYVILCSRVTPRPPPWSTSKITLNFVVQSVRRGPPSSLYMTLKIVLNFVVQAVRNRGPTPSLPVY